MLCHVQKAYLDCAALGPGEACAHQYTFSGSAAPVEVEVDPLGRALVWAAVEVRLAQEVWDLPWSFSAWEATGMPMRARSL